MTNTAATLSIRTYSISRDMWEAGDCAECATCGRSIRHVTVINGATYGARCAEALVAQNTEAVVVEVAVPVKTTIIEVTFEMIEAAAISPVRKSIARQDLIEKKLAQAGDVFGGTTNARRQLNKPMWLLVETMGNSEQRRATAYALIIEVKKAIGGK